MKNYTDITVLVDRSGSMSAIREGMEGMFRTFLKEHKKVPTSRITLITFDSITPLQVEYEDVRIGEARNLILNPRGNTPLLDAMCKTIDRTGERLARKSEQDRPNKVLMLTITDGQENWSREFRREHVRERITRQRESYKWEFVYLGANQDTFAESQSMGIPWSNVMTFTPSAFYVGEDSGFANAFASSTSAYARGASASAGNFTNLQRSNSASLEDRNQESTPK